MLLLLLSLCCCARSPQRLPTCLPCLSLCSNMHARHVTCLQANAQSPDSTAKLRGGGGQQQPQQRGGLLSSLAGGQRFLVSQDENSRGGQRVRLPSFNVDRYSRFNEGPSSSS